MHDFWKYSLLGLVFGIMIIIQIWKKKAWTYLTTFKFEDNPVSFIFFITLYFIVFITIIFKIMETGKEYF